MEGGGGGWVWVWWDGEDINKFVKLVSLSFLCVCR